MSGRHVAAGVLALSLLASAPAAGTGAAADADVALQGIFTVGGPVRGAEVDNGYLYVATPLSLVVYDVRDPASPQLLAARASTRLIHGELISTGGDLLLLNGGLVGGGLDVWNVEDKSNPVLAGTVDGVPDEHFSCLLECAWAYGSDGSIVDLRVPQEPVVQDVSWKAAAGLEGVQVHRLDEYRPGFMATAPRRSNPVVLDVRRPLSPRVVAQTKVPRLNQSMFLYSSWARGGADRFLVTSTENPGCGDDHQAALVTFDTKGWPADRRFEVAGKFRYSSRTEEESCLAYYFSLHPDFEDGGLVLLPNGLEGTRVLEVAGDGTMREVGSFVLPTSDVWLAFWIDAEIFYALNASGEVYVLKYQP